MDYYQLWKEERQITIKKISNKANEILVALDEIETDKNTNIILYYDFIIELLLMGEPIDKELTIEYYNIYSDTWRYNSQQLVYALRAFGNELVNSFDELYNKWPWYQKIWWKIQYWFSKIIK